MGKDIESIDLIIKNISIHYRYKNILVLTQPADGVCVRAIDKRWSDISVFDNDFFVASSPKSKIENIIPGSNTSLPLTVLFGSEPPHDWCYYYEKADLARQQGKWPEVIKLAEQAQKQSLSPNDQIEWMPFLQAYAVAGDMKNVKQLSTRINTEPFYKRQACDILHGMAAAGYPLSMEMQSFADKLFCSKGDGD